MIMFGLRKEKKEDVIKESFDIPASFDETRKDFRPMVEEKEELKSRVGKQNKFILALTITFIVSMLVLVLSFK